MGMLSTVMSFQILWPMSTITTNRTKVTFFTMIFPVMILYSIVGFVPNVALITPKRLFKSNLEKILEKKNHVRNDCKYSRMTFFKVCCQLISGRSSLATKTAHHWNWGSITKVNSFFVFLIFLGLLMHFGMIS